MIDFFKCSFLNPSSLVYDRDDAYRVDSGKVFICSFLIVRKERKEARTLKIIARIFFHFAKTNELTRRTRSNSIRLLTCLPDRQALHCRKFFDAILFMCKHQRIRKKILSFDPFRSGQAASLNHFFNAKFFMSDRKAILLMCDYKEQEYKGKRKDNNDS